MQLGRYAKTTKRTEGTKKLPECPIPVMSLLLSRGLCCELCGHKWIRLSEVDEHFASIHHCRRPGMSYGVVFDEGRSVTFTDR
jgi:hypothetical protein